MVSIPHLTLKTKKNPETQIHCNLMLLNIFSHRDQFFRLYLNLWFVLKEIIKREVLELKYYYQVINILIKRDVNEEKYSCNNRKLK